ncbi:MAG: hypothetical protein IJ113_03045 [Eggerthellaceae bacterium]|nr:hypothetical protein [Eggerthellaceae bacterium]
MAILNHVSTHRGVETAFGKIIPEKEAYSYCLRTIAGFSANIFQLMRVLNDSWEDRTEKITEIANMMNCAACAGGEDELHEYLNAFYDEWNIPELVKRSAWIGAIWGDYGDEAEDMAGRVIQFTENRVEKELDTCPWDIVGSEMCNMTTGMFTANFDIAAGGEHGAITNDVQLNMCEARGCGNPHCRVVAERLDHYGLEPQGWLDHRGAAHDPVHDTPPERRVKHAQGLRSGQYTNAFGEENSLEWQYNWVAQMGWVWSISFPLIAIRDMADDDEEFERLLKIVFSTAGKNSFIDPFAREGLRNWLEIPREIGDNDPRVMGAYIGAMLGCQLVPFEWEAFDGEGVEIRVDQDTFTGRFEMAPLDEITLGYEAQWNGACHTLVSPEWSVWIDEDDDDFIITVGRKIDDRAL